MEKTYPIAETFVSPQGEGQHSGRLMYFVRTAGCNVGQRYPSEMYDEKVLKDSALPIYTNECRTLDGRKFACDTDYRCHRKMTVAQILDGKPDNLGHVCITGGEPFMHDLEPLLIAFMAAGVYVHVETSGTKDASSLIQHLRLEFGAALLWVTCSPKFGCLYQMIKEANELKLLVDKDFSVDHWPIAILEHPLVYIQPVNGENEINDTNLQICLELQPLYPHFILSNQNHKLWKVR